MIKFARETGDLQTLSDMDLKLIALTYTLEAQIHGTEHLRDSPPPVHTVNVKRLPEKDLPGWGSNVPNLEEWEALEHQAEDKSNPQNSKILPLKDLNLNVISDADSEVQEVAEGDVGKPEKHFPKKKEINIEGKKMVADGIDASQGEYGDSGDWMPAVSRSTHRRYLRRKARRERYEASSEKDGVSVNSEITEEKNEEESLSSILDQVRLEQDSLEGRHEDHENVEGEQVDGVNKSLDHLDNSSHISDSVDASNADDDDSEQSWMLRSLSESSVACITSDYAMQNVLLQMGLRLVAPGGMQIRQLHRYINQILVCLFQLSRAIFK